MTPRLQGPPTPRALTVRQPWATCIAHHGKDVENRGWQPRYTGPVLIHAGRLDTDTPDLGTGTAGHLLPTGAVIAAATLTGWHPGHGCCHPWGVTGQWHWTLTGIRPLPDPVPCRGHLGLWWPDTDTLAAVTIQLGEPG